MGNKEINSTVLDWEGRGTLGLADWEGTGTIKAYRKKEELVWEAGMNVQFTIEVINELVRNRYVDLKIEMRDDCEDFGAISVKMVVETVIHVGAQGRR